MTDLSPALTASIVNEHIDETLKESYQHFKESKGLELHRVSDWTKVRDQEKNDNFPLFFGITVHVSKTTEKDGHENSKAQLISFYLGYSTWDGRCLFVDQIVQDEKIEKLLLQVLAKIAIRLDCSRLIWMVRCLL